MANDQAALDAIRQLLQQEVSPTDWREHLRKTQKPRLVPELTASDDDFLEYWRWAETETPADAARQLKLVEICERRPPAFGAIARFLSPDSTVINDRLKSLWDRVSSEHNEASHELAQALREWLMLNSQYFRDELVEAALGIGTGQTEALKRLVRIAPNLAFERLSAKQPKQDAADHSAALAGLARWGWDTSTEAMHQSWIERLKQIAADRSAPLKARSTAFAAVLSVPWPERDSWFLGLFRQPRTKPQEKYEADDNPLAGGVASAPDYWIPQIIPLVTDKDAVVRANAVDCLIQFQNEKARRDALLPILPWVGDRKWVLGADKYSRLRLLQSLTDIEIPECVPHLKKSVLGDKGPELAATAKAIAHYKTTELIAPLKAAARRETESLYRRDAVRALLELDGFTAIEIGRGLRDYALKVAELPDGRWTDESWEKIEKQPHDLLLDVGHEVSRFGVCNDEATKSTLELLKPLVATNPRAAAIISKAIVGWPTPSSYRESIRRLREGDFPAEWLRELIDAKTQFATAFKETSDLAGVAAGIQVAIIANPEAIKRILAGDDPKSKLALLACARVKRLELPIPEVSAFLDGQDKDLVSAADHYLEVLDTPVARQELQKRSRGQARVLGSQLNFSAFEMEKGEISKSERKLRDLVLSPDGPDEIYALLSEGNFGGDGQRALLVYKDHALIHRIDGNGRTRKYDLSTAELNALRDWIVGNDVANLPAYDEGTMDGIQLQYVHITRDGGERVFMNNPPGGPMGAASFSPGISEPRPDPIVYGELTRRMMHLNEKPMEVVYESFQGLAGFRIVHAREDGEVFGLIFENGRLLAGINVGYPKPIEWHKVAGEAMADEFEIRPPDPPERERWPDFTIREDDVVAVREGPLAGKRISPATREKDKLEGLWISGPAGAPELLARGDFANLVLSGGGEWIVVAKAATAKSWAAPNGVVRIHLRDKRMIPVDLPPAENFNPLAWIAAHQRVLLYRQRDDPRLLPPRDKPDPNAGPENPEYHLLDPITGKLERLEGEFRPLRRLEGHDLQPTGKPNEFWAAIIEKADDPEPTTVLGKYSTQQFRFIESVRFPGTWFKSWHCVIDQSNRCAWIAVNGDLLRVHLPETD